VILVSWIGIEEEKMTHKKNNSEEMSCFLVLDVLFWRLNAFLPLWRSP
jgi:hypothetical protein